MKKLSKNTVKSKIKQHKQIIVCCIIFILIILLCLLIIISDNKLRSINNDLIYYRTYTEEEGWSKWISNGEPSGNTKKNYPITKFQIKTDPNISTFNYESYYSESSWISNGYEDGNLKGIKLSLIQSSDLYDKYDLCYRTYNEEDGWLDWSCNFQINGNSNADISAIQIKFVPINAIKRDYLEDYNEMSTNYSIGF